MKRYGMIRLRELKGMSMEQLAEKVEMNVTYLYRVQAGLKTRESTLEKIAKVLECDVKELL